MAGEPEAGAVWNERPRPDGGGRGVTRPATTRGRSWYTLKDGDERSRATGEIPHPPPFPAAVQLRARVARAVIDARFAGAGVRRRRAATGQSASAPARAAGGEGQADHLP